MSELKLRVWVCSQPYFRIMNGTVYLPEATIPITDVGDSYNYLLGSGVIIDPGPSL